MQIPRVLRAGDRVAAVTSSWGGPGTFPHRYEAGKRQFEAETGLTIVEAPHALADPEYLEKHPEKRADDLMAAFEDPSVRGIITTIGGDDAIRLVPHLRLQTIAENPKVLLGFSDSTVLHFACYAAGLRSFYGPSLMTGLAENGGILPYTANWLHRVLMTCGPIGELKASETWTREYLDWADPDNQARKRKLQPNAGYRWVQGDGVATGPLLGGCMETLATLRWSSLWPSLDRWDGAILFLETSEKGATPDDLQRWLRACSASQILNRVSAVLFARPGGTPPPEPDEAYDYVLERVIAREVGRSTVPIVTGLDFGHTDPTMTLPYGARVCIDCNRKSIRIDDVGVSQS